MLSQAMTIRIWPKTRVYLQAPENQRASLSISLVVELTFSAPPDEMCFGVLATRYLVFLLGRKDE